MDSTRQKPSRTLCRMPGYHRLATELNAALERDCPDIFTMLSAWGKAAYFPKDGILGQSAEAKGADINATIGIALDDDCGPMHLSPVAGQETLPPVAVFPYAPSHGLPELRKEWLRQMRVKNPSLKCALSLPVVAAGLTHALRLAGELFVDPGDTLIIAEPLWGNYKLIYPQADIRTFPLFDGGVFNIEGLRGALKTVKKKAVVLLNFPNNPAGYVPTVDEAQAIADALRERAESGTHVAVILDEAYFGLVYEENAERESMTARLGDLHERLLVVKVDGSSKEDFAWGLRVAYCTFACKDLTPAAAHALEEKTAGLVRGSVSSSCHLSQSMLLKAYREPSFWSEKKAREEILRRRFAAAKREAEKDEGLFELLPCNAGYFLCVRLASAIDAGAVRQHLLKESTGVIALPGNLLRIAFCSVPEARMAELFARIRKACASERTPS